MVEINTLYVFKDIAAASDISTNNKAFKFLPFALTSNDKAPPKEDQILAPYDNLPLDIITWLLGVDELLGIGVDAINSRPGAINTDFDPLDPRQIAARIIVEHNISFIPPLLSKFKPLVTLAKDGAELCGVIQLPCSQ